MLWDIEVDPGKMRLAAGLARAAIKTNPESRPARLLLGRALVQIGEWKEAAICLRELIAMSPPSAELEMELVHALIGEDLFEEALPHAKAALAISAHEGKAGEDPRAKRLLFSVLASLGSWDDARLDMSSVLAFSDSTPILMEMHVRSLPAAERLEYCDKQLAANPAHTNAKYLKALALVALGRHEEAKIFMGMDRLVEITTVEPPPGFTSQSHFLESLTSEVRANPTLCRDHRNKAVRGALRTRFLRQPGAKAIDALLGAIRLAVDSWELQLEASHDEFLRGRPRRARLKAWAVIQDADGRQKGHRHPDGWLSGVYYVAASRSATDGSWQAPLILGALDEAENGGEPPWGTRAVEPVPGRLVLFPSYVPHGTEPGGVDGARICVAFDVVPVTN